jgi:IS5 family transposase
MLQKCYTLYIRLILIANLNEGVFAVLGKRARYRGIVKNLFQALMEALVFNLKRLIKIVEEPVPLLGG